MKIRPWRRKGRSKMLVVKLPMTELGLNKPARLIVDRQERREGLVPSATPMNYPKKRLDP